MVRILTSKSVRAIVSLSSVGALLIAFQNCSGSMAANEGQDLASSSVDSKTTQTGTDGTTGIPFGNAGPCVLDGVEVAQGSSILAYADRNVPAGQSCRMEMRQCVNGFLMGSYQYRTCTVDANPNGSCSFNGQTIASGSSVDAYLAPFGTTCVKQKRECLNGTLSGSYNYSSCTTPDPAVAKTCERTPGKVYVCQPSSNLSTKNLPALDGSASGSPGNYNGITAMWWVRRVGGKKYGNINEMDADRCLKLCATSYPGGTQRVCNYSGDDNTDDTRTCRLITDLTCKEQIVAFQIQQPWGSSFSATCH